MIDIFTIFISFTLLTCMTVYIGTSIANRITNDRLALISVVMFVFIVVAVFSVVLQVNSHLTLS